MRRALPFLFVCMAGVAGIISVAAPASAAPPDASRCVNISSAQLTSGMAFDVQNACDARLTCALTWTLSCENASGKTTSKSKQEARFNLGASDTHHTTGSADSCKDGWKIDDVAWDCAAASK